MFKKKKPLINRWKQIKIECFHTQAKICREIRIFFSFTKCFSFFNLLVFFKFKVNVINDLFPCKKNQVICSHSKQSETWDSWDLTCQHFPLNGGEHCFGWCWYRCWTVIWFLVWLFQHGKSLLNNSNDLFQCDSSNDEWIKSVSQHRVEDSESGCSNNSDKNSNCGMHENIANSFQNLCHIDASNADL